MMAELKRRQKVQRRVPSVSGKKLAENILRTLRPLLNTRKICKMPTRVLKSTSRKEKKSPDDTIADMTSNKSLHPVINYLLLLVNRVIYQGTETKYFFGFDYTVIKRLHCTKRYKAKHYTHYTSSSLRFVTYGASKNCH